jgi:hypothetical protein
MHWTDFAGQEPEWAYARLALPAAFLATVRADSTGSGWSRLPILKATSSASYGATRNAL